MKRAQFFTRLRRWCRENGRSFRIDTVAGKGSHVRLHVGSVSTIVKDGELSPVYVQLVMKQLDLPKDLIQGK